MEGDGPDAGPWAKKLILLFVVVAEQAAADDFDRSAVVDMFKVLEFHSLMDRIPGVGEGDEIPALEAPAEPEIALQYVTVDTPDKLEAMALALEAAKAFAFDTETTSTDPMLADLVGISASTEPGRAWYVPVGHGRSGPGDAAEEDLGDLPLFAVQETPEGSPTKNPRADAYILSA